MALDGLPLEYASFSFAIRTKSDVLSVEEFNTLLDVEEKVIKKRFCLVDVNTMAKTANFQSKGLGRGRGKNNNQRGCGGRGFNGGNPHTNPNNFINGNVS